MKITIAERLHPFSHRLGTKFLVPRTSWCVQVFPTRLCFSNLENEIDSFFISFDLQGPFKEFTAELNLEQNSLRVFGQTSRGYIRYQIFSKEKAIWLKMEKIPPEGVNYRTSSNASCLFLGTESLCLFSTREEAPPFLSERLSLGNHKAQDWDLMRRRLDLKEIFPHWLALGRSIPSDPVLSDFPLLLSCKEKIRERKKENVLASFEELFLAGFEGLLVPRGKDEEYQGILPAGFAASTPLLSLLKESAECIRSLFIQERDGVISLLPCLPPLFHCGRMLNVGYGEFSLSFEWAKKRLKKVVIIAKGEANSLRLKFPKGFRSFRVLGSGPLQTLLINSQGEAILSLSPGKTLQLDCFK